MINDLAKAPVLMNSMGPFDMPVYKYSMFAMPDDMFIDYNNSKLSYNASVVWCSLHKLFKTGILKVSSNSSDVFVFAYSDNVVNCNVSVTATNTHNLSAEAIVSFHVYRCASK